MVDPQARRRGVGSALLRAALPLAAERGAASVLLVVPRSTDAGREFALRHGGTLDHSEHHLVLVATPPPPGKHSDLLVRDAAAGDVDELLRLLEAAFGPTSDSSTLLPTTPADRQLVVERAGAVIGCLRLSTSGATSTGIYGFAVDPQLRGQGIGRAVLAQVCRQLCAAGPHEVTLEVAVDNEHALGLYTSVGFDRKTTEDYYKVSTEPTT